MPFFEGCDPFATWMDDTSAAAEDAYWALDNEGSGAAKLLSSVEKLVREEGGGELVGVVGFSMGAKVGMEVVRRLEARGGGEGKGVRVMVSVCGTVPYRGGGDAAREEGGRRMLERGLVKAQSVHLIGETDPWRAEGEKLIKFFAEERRKVIWFKGGHHMPAEDAVNKQVAKIMLAACPRGNGS